MIKLYSLPRSLNSEEKPVDGVYEKKFNFCEKHFNNKCINHYKSIKGKDGYHICPYGFTTYVTKINNIPITYTSIEVKEHSNRKLVKRRTTKKDEKKSFNSKEIEKIKNWEANIDANFNAKNNILRDYDKNVKTVSQKKEVLDDTLHELRKLNNILKKQAFLLKTEIKKINYDQNEISERSKNINSTTQLVSARLNAYDFTLNPEIIESNPPAKISLYRKFEKARYCLEVITNELGIDIKFQGESRSRNYFFEIIDILPFILLENSIKFNYNKNPIVCKFIESENELEEILVINKTELPQDEEVQNLKKKHIRSKHIEEIAGSGKGLYIASLICDYHNIDMQIETHFEKVIDNTKVGDFIIKLNLSEIDTER